MGKKIYKCKNTHGLRFLKRQNKTTITKRILNKAEKEREEREMKKRKRGSSPRITTQLGASLESSSFRAVPISSYGKFSAPLKKKITFNYTVSVYGI